MDFDDSFVRKFNSIYNKYAGIIEQNKGYNSQVEMNSVIKAMMSILVLYSSLVENTEFERIFYNRVMRFEPLLILINELKSEFETILFGYAEIANSAHSPVIGIHAISNENLNEPEVKEFSYPEVRVINRTGYRYRTHLMPKSGEVRYELEATNVLPLEIERRKITRSKKKGFRTPTKANTNTRKLKELIKERKAKNVKNVKKVKKSKGKPRSMNRLGIKI
jgi:hypothetical protein